MGLPGHTARGTRVTMGAVTSCTGLTNPIYEGVRCMMIAGLSISPILVSKKVAEDESAPMAFPEPMVWARTLGAVSSAWRTDSVPDVPRAVLRYAWLNGTTINRKVSPVKASAVKGHPSLWRRRRAAVNGIATAMIVMMKLCLRSEEHTSELQS